MYEIETFNLDRVVLYASGIYKLNKISGKYHLDITEKKYRKCLIDCVVFKGTDCVNEMLDCVLSYKGNQKKLILRLLKIIYT